MAYQRKTITVPESDGVTLLLAVCHTLNVYKAQYMSPGLTYHQRLNVRIAAQQYTRIGRDIARQVSAEWTSCVLSHGPDAYWRTVDEFEINLVPDFTGCAFAHAVFIADPNDPRPEFKDCGDIGCEYDCGKPKVDSTGRVWVKEGELTWHQVPGFGCYVAIGKSGHLLSVPAMRDNGLPCADGGTIIGNASQVTDPDACNDGQAFLDAVNAILGTRYRVTDFAGRG